MVEIAFIENTTLNCNKLRKIIPNHKNRPKIQSKNCRIEDNKIETPNDTLEVFLLNNNSFII